jgi:hypothetical protein
MLLLRFPYCSVPEPGDAMPKARSKIKTAKKAVPWYLSGGDEQCAHCGQSYTYELEFRCPDCDGPSCPHCKSKHEDERFVCAACVVVVREDVANGG